MKTRKVGLRQLLEFIENPTELKVLRSGRFLNKHLRTGISTVLEAHTNLPRPIRESFCVRRVENTYSRVENTVRTLFEPETLLQSETHVNDLATVLRDVDVDVRSMCSELRDDTERLKYHEEEVNALMVETFEFLLHTRLYLSHYNHAIQVIDNNIHVLVDVHV